MFQRRTLLAAHTFFSSKKDITNLNVNGFFNPWKTVYPFKMFSLSHTHTHTIFLSSPRANFMSKETGEDCVKRSRRWPLTSTSDPEPAVWERVVRVKRRLMTPGYHKRGRKRLFCWVCFEAIRYPILCAGAHITSSTALHHIPCIP